jgi:hypothetical protein
MNRNQSEKRIDMRFDKVFPVVVGSEIYGDSSGIARNLSAGGMLVEMVEPIPLGAIVTVHFHMPDSHGDVAVRAEVKHQFCFNYSRDSEPARTRGIGLKFVEFVEDGARRLEESFSRERVLH